jgi:hypothetical protein
MNKYCSQYAWNKQYQKPLYLFVCTSSNLHRIKRLFTQMLKLHNIRINVLHFLCKLYVLEVESVNEKSYVIQFAFKTVWMLKT